MLLQNLDNIATIYARPNTPKYGKEPVLSEESACGIFGGLGGTRQIFYIGYDMIYKMIYDIFVNCN